MRIQASYGFVLKLGIPIAPKIAFLLGQRTINQQFVLGQETPGPKGALGHLNFKEQDPSATHEGPGRQEKWASKEKKVTSAVPFDTVTWWNQGKTLDLTTGSAQGKPHGFQGEAPPLLHQLTDCSAAFAAYVAWKSLEVCQPRSTKIKQVVFHQALAV